MRILLYIIIISVIGVSVLFLLFSYFLQRFFHIPHVGYRKNPEILDVPFRDHRIHTCNEKKIQIWEMNPDHDSGWPILFTHGWANASDCFFPLIPAFLEKWHVFLLNTRNHGESDDDRYSSILQFREDISNATDFIFKQNKNAEGLVLVGHSLGAAASLYAASMDQRIKAVISIASFSNMEEFMRKWLRRQRIPKVFIRGIIRFIELRAGIHFSDLSPDHTISRFDCPVLLVHGTQDETVPFKALHELESATERENVETLKMKGHNHSSMLRDRQLAKDVGLFLNKYLGNAGDINSETGKS